MEEKIEVSRVEKKYILSLMEAGKLWKNLKQILPGDEINGYEPYRVRSLYFDSYYNDDYLEKLEGIRDRKKIRLRIYDTKTKSVKLELKQKNGENQKKHSLIISKEEACELQNGRADFLWEKEEPVAKQIYGILKKEVYRPKCIVEYQRRALAVPSNNIRITFDSEIVTSEGNLDLFQASKKSFQPAESVNQVIMEVKYNHFLLSYVKDSIGFLDVTEGSYSKYIAARKFG